MTSSIQETVNATLQNNGLGSYMSHARPVVDALQGREAEMAETLISFAVQQGMDETAATAAIREVGMYLPPPPVATIASASAQNQEADPRHRAEGGDDDALAATLARINDTLEDLAGFARQNGWRPTR